MLKILKTYFVPSSIVFACILIVLLSGCNQDRTNTPLNAEGGLAGTVTATAPVISNSQTPSVIELTPTLEAMLSAADDTPTPEIEEIEVAETIRCGSKLPVISVVKPSINDLEGILLPDSLVPDEALPALRRLIENPGSVGLAAFEIGRESDGVFLNADAPMPLASVVKVVNLVAYAEAVDEGRIDPAAWIPLAEMDRAYLPGMDLGSHRRAIRALEEQGLIAGEPPATPMEEIPTMMIRYSSNAATDYLHLLVGQEEVEMTAISLGLTSQTAPCPWIGQFLAMSNHQRNGSNIEAVRAFIEDPKSYEVEVMRLSDSFMNDPEFRDQALSYRSSRASIQVQSLFSENLNAQASARDYSRLMAKIISNELSSSYTNILVRRALEWPMIFPDNQLLFRVVGYKSGSLPGILTTIYYAERLEDQAQVVVALFFRDLPRGTYRNWRQSLPHDVLARWLLSDPEAISEMKKLIGDGSN